MVFPDPKYIETNGIRMAVYDGGAEGVSKPCPLVFLHGFPELAYSWRHQMKALSAEGWRVIAPDLRGYGRTDAPEDVASYAGENLARDVEGMLDALGLEKAVFIGHDWGALLLWMLPFFMPRRVMGLAGLSVPYQGRAPADVVTMVRHAFDDDHYIHFFQKEGAAEALFEKDVARTLRFFLRVKDGAPSIGWSAEGGALQKGFALDEASWGGRLLLNEEDMRVFVAAFQKSGFRGGLNWYRNMAENWRRLGAFDSDLITLPTLMLMATDDPILPPSLADGMAEKCPDLELHFLEGAGHWLQQERHEDVTRHISRWLERRFVAM